MYSRRDFAGQIFLRSLAVAVLSVTLSLGAGCQSRAPVSTAVVNVCGSTISVQFDGATSTVSRADLLDWVLRAGKAVCIYYGRFPVPRLRLEIHIRGSAGVHGGVTYPDGGGYITISLGENTAASQLREDWMLTHEMIHLAFPSMARRHHWIEEGISVYVEPVARVQAGQLSAERMWSDVIRDMPQGEPAPGDDGLDHTHTWGRTYWGGAMYCLVADVRIRQKTGNRKGLQDALRGIVNAGGNITQDWDIERALSVGDKTTGTTVLVDLYRSMRDQPSPIDLPGMWKSLGIAQGADGSVRFDSTAPLADIRAKITQAPADHPGQRE
jgi:hypothetical protein